MAQEVRHVREAALCLPVQCARGRKAAAHAPCGALSDEMPCGLRRAHAWRCCPRPRVCLSFRAQQER